MDIGEFNLVPRKISEKEIKKYMHSIYNPLYFNTKPKFRKRTSYGEWIRIKDLVENIYNPLTEDFSENNFISMDELREKMFT